MICTECGRSVEPGAQFCSGCGRALQANSYALARPERLVRPREGRMIAGVCAGFAQRYGWDVSLVRLVLVLGVIFGAGMPFLVYVIAWIVMPNVPLSLPAQAGGGYGPAAATPMGVAGTREGAASVSSGNAGTTTGGTAGVGGV